MNRHRAIAFGASAAILYVAAQAVVGQESADVEGWLDRMNDAIERLNYRGTFVHVVDGNAEELRIVHRYADGVVGERIIATGDGGSELLRNEDGVRSVFPDKKLVVIEAPERSSIPVAPSLRFTDELERYYQMTSFTKGRVADRETQIVNILPRDEYRYGYLLYLDRLTALPLKIEVRNEVGNVVESILFTEISVVDSIPDHDVAPSVSGEGFVWKRPVADDSEGPDTELWGATRLPNGFRISLAHETRLAGSKYPVQHLVYTDGLATVSVFIAHPKSDPDMPEGFSHYGSTNAYSLMIDGRLATAIGEVPGRTVQRIATSLDAR